MRFCLRPALNNPQHYLLWVTQIHSLKGKKQILVERCILVLKLLKEAHALLISIGLSFKQGDFISHGF